MTDDEVFHRDVARDYPVAARGEGVYLWDDDGKRYIDGVSSVFVTGIGHGVREVADAVHRQCSQLAFANTRFFTSSAERELCRRLVAIGGGTLAKAWICTSGSTATETSLKIARQYHVLRGQPQKTKVIARWHSYHGSTLAALSLTGDVPRRRMFEPYLSEFPHIDPPYCYRCPLGKTYPSCEVACAGLLERAIQQIGPEHVSAFIVEPVAGGPLGALVAPDEYLPRIRQICDRYDVLMIADEVVSGVGRTGAWLGVHHWNVAPDIVTLAKGLAGGHSPIGAVLVSRNVYDTFAKAGANLVHYETFTGAPSASAAAAAVLDYVELNDLVKRAHECGQYLAERLSTLRRLACVGDVRGLGLLRGIELVQEQVSKRPFPAAANVGKRVVDSAFARGLLIAAGSGCADGENGDTLVVAPPYVITRDQIDDLVERLEQAILEVAASPITGTEH